jgi:Fuc2NAc and GlcNAc transferase
MVLAVAVLALVWHINLYNFMDGIDALAGAQTLVFTVGAQVVGQGLPGWPGDVLWLCTGSVLGFLAFNWPPARIFMGDVGSYFLGLITAAVAVLLWQQHTLALPVSLILLCGFWFDASYTLIVRALTGQAFTQPHRTHLYQKIAAKRGHLWTTVCYLVYATFWLVPLSWLCARHGTGLFPATLLWVLPAVTPLAMAAWWLRAGLPGADDHGRHD